MSAPKFAPRFKQAHIAAQGHEVEAMLEVLGGDYKDAKSAARKAVSTGLSFVASRSWWLIASTLDGAYPTFYGLFATEGAAQKALDQNSLGLFGLASIHEVRGLDERQHDVAKWEDEARSKMCFECGHAQAAHRWPFRKGAVSKFCIITNEDGEACACPVHVPPPDTIPAPSVS